MDRSKLQGGFSPECGQGGLFTSTRPDSIPNGRHPAVYLARLVTGVQDCHGGAVEIRKVMRERPSCPGDRLRPWELIHQVRCWTFSASSRFMTVNHCSHHLQPITLHL